MRNTMLFAWFGTTEVRNIRLFGGVWTAEVPKATPLVWLWTIDAWQGQDKHEGSVVSET